jgi:hypothetical protein
MSPILLDKKAPKVMKPINNAKMRVTPIAVDGSLSIGTTTNPMSNSVPVNSNKDTVSFKTPSVNLFKSPDILEIKMPSAAKPKNNPTIRAMPPAIYGLVINLETKAITAKVTVNPSKATSKLNAASVNSFMKNPAKVETKMPTSINAAKNSKINPTPINVCGRIKRLDTKPIATIVAVKPIKEIVSIADYSAKSFIGLPARYPATREATVNKVKNPMIRITFGIAAMTIGYIKFNNKIAPAKIKKLALIIIIPISISLSYLTPSGPKILAAKIVPATKIANSAKFFKAPVMSITLNNAA